MTEVIMPKMGDAMEEGTLVDWLKKDGDKVKSGEVIGNIQTDKATLELEAPGSGTLTGFLIQGGDTVPVGQPIAAILKEGEKLPEGWGKDGKPAKHGAAEPQPMVAPSQPTRGEVQAPANAPIEMQQEAASDPTAPTGAETEAGYTPRNPSIEREAHTQHEVHEPEILPAQPGRVKASPLARKVAAERGVDLGSIKGSGPGGRIVERDVRSATPRPAGTSSAPPLQEQTVKLNRLRQITAQKTTESKQQVPHFYVTVEVDVDRLMNLRQMFEEDGAGKVSVNDFVTKACAAALLEMPVVNSSYQGQTLQQHGSVNIGMAVATDEGLTVPVMKSVDRMSLAQIGAASRDLAKKARENKLSLDELTGATFTISNMGMLDVDEFSAIIVPPNAAILAIATARKKVVVTEDDELEIRWRMNVTGSFDHRVVDGAVGAQFINLVRGYLENPTRLLG